MSDPYLCIEGKLGESKCTVHNGKSSNGLESSSHNLVQTVNKYLNEGYMVIKMFQNSGTLQYHLAKGGEEGE